MTGEQIRKKEPIMPIANPVIFSKPANKLIAPSAQPAISTNSPNKLLKPHRPPHAKTKNILACPESGAAKSTT